MIADMLTNKKLHLIITELLNRGGTLSISLAFISQSYFAVPKNIRLNPTHYFIMKVASKQELYQIAINHLPGIEITDFINIYKKWTAKPYSFLVNDAALASDNVLCLRHNLLERTWKLIMTINDTIRDEKL